MPSPSYPRQRHHRNGVARPPMAGPDAARAADLTALVVGLAQTCLLHPGRIEALQDLPDDLPVDPELRRLVRALRATPPERRHSVAIQLWLAEQGIDHAVIDRVLDGDDALPVSPDHVQWAVEQIRLLAERLRRSQQAQELARRLADDPDDPDAWAALRAIAEERRPAGIDPGSYAVQDGRIVRRRVGPDGLPVLEVLAHFQARIVEEIVEDDGAERVRRLVISGELPDGRPLPTVTVSAAEFPGMAWVVREWGTRAVVAAGQARRDALREAIQRLSGEVPERCVYAHTGWRRIGDRWAYLHAGGAIGAEGVEVRLPERLARYVLPPPPTDPETVRQALRAVLRLREVWRANPAAAWALLATTWRAPLGSLVPATVTVWLYGPSGAHKTTTAALAISQYGDWDTDHVPETWLSTDNALEQALWLASDLPLLIDDYAPSRARDDAETMRRTAERVIRRVGNHAGRARLRPDLTAAPERPPRALPIVTAEELPSGRISALARLFAVAVERGQTDREALTALQAEQELLRLAGAAYVDWLRQRLDGEPNLAAALRARQEALRAQVLRDGHPRVADNVAVLAVGVEVWLAMAVERGVLAEAEAQALHREALGVLTAAAEEQARLLEQEAPEILLLQALEQLIGSGRVALVPLGQPGPEGVPVVGWYDRLHIYLLPDVAYEQAERLLARGRGLGAGPQAIWRALERRGALVRVEQDRVAGRLPVALPDGSRPRVIRLLRDRVAALGVTLAPAEEGEPA